MGVSGVEKQYGATILARRPARHVIVDVALLCIHVLNYHALILVISSTRLANPR
jgi:hypothetical protein